MADWLKESNGAKAGSVLKDKYGRPMKRNGLLERVMKIGKRAKVEVTSHALRRFFCTSNLLKGRPLPLVQRAMGHSDISTTRSYCTESEQQVVEAMRGWE